MHTEIANHSPLSFLHFDEANIKLNEKSAFYSFTAGNNFSSSDVIDGDKYLEEIKQWVWFGPYKAKNYQQYFIYAANLDGSSKYHIEVLLEINPESTDTIVLAIREGTENVRPPFQFTMINDS